MNEYSNIKGHFGGSTIHHVSPVTMNAPMVFSETSVANRFVRSFWWNMK